MTTHVLAMHLTLSMINDLCSSKTHFFTKNYIIAGFVGYSSSLLWKLSIKIRCNQDQSIEFWLYIRRFDKSDLEYHLCFANSSEYNGMLVIRLVYKILFNHIYKNLK